MAVETEVIEPRRRVNPVLIVILVLLALAALVFFVIIPLFGGDEEAAAPPARRPAPSVTSTPSPSPAQPPAETFEQFGSKDPFRPLVTAGAPPTTGGPAPAPSPAPAGPGAAGAPAPTGGQRVALLDIFEEGGTQKAQVRVGSTVYTVEVGQVFATNFKLVSISGNCATLLHGDDKFTLCEGEEVIK